MERMTDEGRALGERWIKAGGGWKVAAASPSVGGNTLRVIALDNEGVPVEWLVTRDSGGPSVVTAYGRPGWARVVWDDQVPDPRDPATLGTWLATVRERYNDSDLHVLPLFRDLACTERVWVVVSERAEPKRLRVASGASEADALVAALESGLADKRVTG